MASTWTKYTIDLTCKCGARLQTFRELPFDADRAVREFHKAHKDCRKPERATRDTDR